MFSNAEAPPLRDPANLGCVARCNEASAEETFCRCCSTSRPADHWNSLEISEVLSEQAMLYFVVLPCLCMCMCIYIYMYVC